MPEQEAKKPRGLGRTLKAEVVEELTPFEQLKSLYMHAIASLEEEETQSLVHLFTGAIHECDAMLKEADESDAVLIPEFHYIYAMSLTHLAHLSQSIEDQMEDVSSDEEQEEEKSREEEEKEAAAISHSPEETHAFLTAAIKRIARGIQANRDTQLKWENASTHFNVALTMAYARRACLGMKGEAADIQFACITFDKVSAALLAAERVDEGDVESTLLPLLAIFNTILDVSALYKQKLSLVKWMQAHFLVLTPLNALACYIGLGDALLTTGQSYCDLLEDQKTKAIAFIELAEGVSCGDLAERTLRECINSYRQAITVCEGGEETVEVRRLLCSIGEATINLGNCLEIQEKNGEDLYKEAVAIFKHVKSAGGESGVPERFMELISTFEEGLGQ